MVSSSSVRKVDFHDLCLPLNLLLAPMLDFHFSNTVLEVFLRLKLMRVLNFLNYLLSFKFPNSSCEAMILVCAYSK